MSKYYIKPTGEELFDYTRYLDEEFAVLDDLWLGGNPAFKELNSSMEANVEEAFDKSADAFEDIYYPPDNAPEITEEDMAKKIKDTIQKNFLPLKIGQKSLKNSDIVKIFSFIEEYEYVGMTELDRRYMFCDLLEILNGEPFITGTLYGNKSSEWINYICPEALKDMLPFFEAVFFDTGTEYFFDKTPHDSPGKFTKNDKDRYYTELKNEVDVKKWAAKLINCNAADIEILPVEWGGI